MKQNPDSDTDNRRLPKGRKVRMSEVDKGDQEDQISSHKILSHEDKTYSVGNTITNAMLY